MTQDVHKIINKQIKKAWAEYTQKFFYDYGEGVKKYTDESIQIEKWFKNGHITKKDVNFFREISYFVQQFFNNNAHELSGRCFVERHLEDDKMQYEVFFRFQGESNWRSHVGYKIGVFCKPGISSDTHSEYGLVIVEDDWDQFKSIAHFFSFKEAQKILERFPLMPSLAQNLIKTIIDVSAIVSADANCN